MVQHKESSASEKQLVALGKTLQTLREAESADILVAAVLDYLQAYFDYALVWIGLYDRVDHRLFGKGGTSPSPDQSFLRQKILLKPGDILEQIVVQQRPYGIPDLREESRAGIWQKAAQRFNIQGALLFPIRHRDRCFGVALLGSHLWGVSPRSEEKARLAMVLSSLGAALYQIETDWQRQQVKRPDQPLLTLLHKLRSLPTLAQRLEEVVEQTHLFVAPSRTNVYWFERERRYFWRRVGNRQKAGTVYGVVADLYSASNGIMVQEVNTFYQSLVADQMVAVSEAQSSLRSDVTNRLMQHLKARSLLAAPIIFQNELLGFLSVEGNEARLWEEEEKNFVRGAAQLIALTAPLEEMEENVQRIRTDQALMAGVARSIYSDTDWKAALKTSAEALCARLKAERFLVLLHDRDSGTFEICYQSQPNNRRPVTSPLATLNEVDWQMLERATEPIAIENLEDDLKLLAWRNAFLELGVHSLLVSSTSLGHQLEGLLLIAHEASRTWNGSERSIVQAVAQQVGLILHQWQLQKQADQQQRMHASIQWGITSMQQAATIDRLENMAVQHIAQVLQVPLAALATWTPGRRGGRLSATACTSDKFSLNAEMVLPVHTDPLLQWALQTDGLLPLNVNDLPAETRQWMCGREIGQILVMALRTARDHEPSGVLIVADRQGRKWPERYLNAFAMLVNQLAWCRRHLLLQERTRQQCQELERLNWYKQRRIEDIYRSINSGIRKIADVINQKDALGAMRLQQSLRYLQGSVMPLTRIIKQEQWHLRTAQETAPLAGLLKRTLERVDEIIKQRQLWSQVHNQANASAVLGGDIDKIELISYELMLAACTRAKVGGRIDIWCRPIDDRWLEISITDNGEIEPQLLKDLEDGRSSDLLAPSTLDRPPGLHLAICQALMQQAGGELTIAKLEDERILSRLVLPLAAP
ncbi:GAF domain-containing protein [Leptolyngbya sp. FACHB-261]|nr:GAF domain-containing protein [Leptolyngbya sp. FACHB-261]